MSERPKNDKAKHEQDALEHAVDRNSWRVSTRAMMMRLFRIFVLAPFAGHHHIDGTAPAPGTGQPLMPIENRRLGNRTAAPFRQDRAQPDIGIRGTRQSRVAPGEAVRLAEGEAPEGAAPLDQTNMGGGRIPQRHQRAAIGFHRLNSVSQRGLPYGQNEWRFRATP